MLDSLSSERDASRALVALRRHWWVILVVAVISAGGAYLLAKRKPKEYSASAALLIRDAQLDQRLFGNQILNSPDPNREAATNQSLVGLPTVANLVAGQMHIPPSTVVGEVSFGSDAQSDVITVTATDHDPRAAATMANTYVQQYIAFRQAADRSQFSQAMQVIDRNLAAIPLPQQNSPTAKNLRFRRDELQLLGGLQTGNAEVVQTATPPASPVAPNPTRDAMIGLILGLLVSGALVTVLERRDRRIKSPEEIEELYGVPIVGTIPDSNTLRGPGAAGTSREQDAFRMLRAQLRYFDVDRDIKRVLITSADGGEGKSLVALNLARAAGQADGKRALLLETDLRRPCLAAMIGLESVAGLAELLSHSQDLVSGLRELVVTPEPVDVSGPAPSFDVLLAGATPPNPVELLESKRMAELMDLLETRYDIVIIDTSPIGLVSDPISLVHRVDGLLVICRFGRSRRDQAVRLMKQLRGLNAQVLGVVVNGLQPGAGGYYRHDRHGSRGDRKSARRGARGAGSQISSRIR